ncbi:MAG: hypothetical protein J0L69_15235, partial [Bacteroidetes bacterium]|nr:hypothetical protein [Bacteroidota bacterium]
CLNTIPQGYDESVSQLISSSCDNRFFNKLPATFLAIISFNERVYLSQQFQMNSWPSLKPPLLIKNPFSILQINVPHKTGWQKYERNLIPQNFLRK